MKFIELCEGGPMMFGHQRARRVFLSYAAGTLPPDESRKLEAHLTGCESCRAAFVRLKDGYEFAVKFAGIEKKNTPAGKQFETAPDFTAALTEAGRGSAGRRIWDGMRTRWSLALSTPRAVWILAIFVIAQAAFLAVINREAFFGKRGAAPVALSGIDIGRFQNLEIAELPLNAHPHIATEGYVRNVWMDDEEKTLHFKLTAGPEGESPYVVCEILSPERISAPRAGSRVRVYGVARYDAQVGRQWHEVNPVLNISILKK